jgi:hypothetical protein
MEPERFPGGVAAVPRVGGTGAWLAEPTAGAESSPAAGNLVSGTALVAGRIVGTAVAELTGALVVELNGTPVVLLSGAGLTPDMAEGAGVVELTGCSVVMVLMVGMYSAVEGAIVLTSVAGSMVPAIVSLEAQTRKGMM